MQSLGQKNTAKLICNDMNLENFSIGFVSTHTIDLMQKNKCDDHFQSMTLIRNKAAWDRHTCQLFNTQQDTHLSKI